MMSIAHHGFGNDRYALTEQKRELTLVKELVRAMRLANPGVRALQVNLEKKNVSAIHYFCACPGSDRGG